MKRREFITLLGGAAAWPLAARAQQGERARWIGVLIGVAEDAETKAWVATFHKRLDELGWRVGGNLHKSRNVGLQASREEPPRGFPRPRPEW